jgi:hypothetical protein
MYQHAMTGLMARGHPNLPTTTTITIIIFYCSNIFETFQH